MRICTPDTEHQHGRCRQPPAVVLSCGAARTRDMARAMHTHPGWRAAGRACASGREFDSFNDFFVNQLVCFCRNQTEQVLRERLCALGALPVAVPGGCRCTAVAVPALTTALWLRCAPAEHTPAVRGAAASWASRQVSSSFT